MADFLKFYPDGKYLYVEILAKEYIKHQPNTKEGMENIAKAVKPIVAELERFCDSKKLKEITVVNLEGVNLAQIKPEYTIKLITLLHSERPDFKHLERIDIINGNLQFEMMYDVVKFGLPGPLKKIIQFKT